MRAACAVEPAYLRGWEPIWAGRRKADGINWILPENLSTASLPAADAVLALWGVAPGKGDVAKNIELAQRAVEIAQLCGAKRVLHCSSSAVYGPGQDCSERAKLSPVSAYGLAKMAMEERIFLMQATRPAGPRSCAFRLANVVGADSLFAAMSSGEPVSLDAIEVGKSPVRSYATAGIVWQAVSAVLASEDMPGVLNVAAADPVAMHNLLEAAGHRFVWRPAPFSAVSEVSVDVSRLQALTGMSLMETPDGMIRQWRALTEGVA